MPRPVETQFDQFMDLARERAATHPWAVVICMHEYFRNLYPSDPYLPFDPSVPPIQRVRRVLDGCARLLKNAGSFGSYFARGHTDPASVASGRRDTPGRADEGPTQQVYGAMWDTFDFETCTEGARNVLIDRFRYSDFELTSLAGKDVLDQGCGSGRYTMALAAAGARRVIGIDLGGASLETAIMMARKAGLETVTFERGDVLAMPYEDASFDFVFSNGVLHHTESTERGIEEMFRVLKPGGRAFLYLYADGGLFWHSRKKMPPVMKQIDQRYTMAVLDRLGMPSNRFPFVDNWYVPVERHTRREYLESFLESVGFVSIQKIVSGRATDLDSHFVQQMPDAGELWGEGEHRYLLGKD
jgi:ubiquinone/menaquinone biosynthesis C-methylase UbiE